MKTAPGALLLLLAPAVVVAQPVSSATGVQAVLLAGRMGGKALLVVDGRPLTLAVGESAAGVRLLQLQDDEAVVERGGIRSSLRVGGAPARLATAGNGAGAARGIAGGAEAVIPAGPGGHFVAAGAINGRAVQFMVDTGATLVSLSQLDADRIGLDWRGGQRVTTNTANGTAQAVLVMLSRVRVGDVELANVGAVVVPTALPLVLLGNSFLSRLAMRRENDVMRLEARP